MAAIPDGTPLYIGLMSGTSADGIDAAVVAFEEGANAPRCTLVAGHAHAWDPTLREALVALGEGREAGSLDVLGRLDALVGE
ncbi:MAG TPA: anhydro-N-acetylmuramic acid kinase, partial [Stenotrophomonas sp.]|nr:anhydro-N-acetylmuramic acid kinase [Stenotrophomonas sp.]